MSRLDWKSTKWQHVRRDLYVAADFTCVDCGWRPQEVPEDYDGRRTVSDATPQDWRMLGVDHIVPRHLGGTNDLTNLQVMCNRCNSRKGHREQVTA